MAKMIEFQDVSKAFGELQVLKNLDMHVNSGEKLALIRLFFLLVSIPSAYAAMRLERRFRPQNSGGR